MAEFCLECLNRINETQDSPKKYIFSKELDLCEGCGEWKRVVIVERKYYYLRKLRYFILPFKIIYWTLYCLWRLLILPYLIYTNRKRKNKNKKLPS